MDRYTFRGKRVDNGEWVYGDMTRDYFGHGFSILDGYQRGKVTAIQQDTVGQCTGMKDKNGKMIFEGDINHDGRWIKYEDGAFCLVHPQDEGDLEYMADFQTEWFDIVGNIHDNAS